MGGGSTGSDGAYGTRAGGGSMMSGWVGQVMVGVGRWWLSCLAVVDWGIEGNRVRRVYLYCKWIMGRVLLRLPEKFLGLRLAARLYGISV